MSHRAAPPGHPGPLDLDRRSVTRVVAALGLAAVGSTLPGSTPAGLPSAGSADGSDGLDPTGQRDSAPALQALYDAGVRAVHLEPRGTYLLDTPVFLDHEDPFDCLVLHGNGAEVVLGDRLGRTDAFTADPEVRWAFFPNTVRSAHDGDAVTVDADHRGTGTSVGGTPRLVVHQLVVDGRSQDRGLAFFNRCAGRFSEVVMKAARTLVSWTDYCDAMVLDHCQARLDEVDDAWLLYQVDHGDGVLLLSPKTERGIGAASLQDCRGATIVSAVTGRLRLTRCRGVAVLAGHAEGDLSAASTYEVRSSQVVVDASLVYPARDDALPGVVVDDTDEGLGSHVVLRDVCEMVFHRDGASTVKASRLGDVVAAPMVSLRAVQPSTRVVVERASTRVGTLSGGSRWLPSAGFRVVSDDDAVTAALAAPWAQWQLATGSWELVQRDGWRVLPAGGGGVAAALAPAAPELVDARGSVDGVVGGLSGSVTYTAAVRDASGGWTAAAPPVDADPGEDGSVRLRLRTTGPGALVVWRGRAGAGPQVSASLLVSGPEVVLYDTGAHLGGVPWDDDPAPVPAGPGSARDLLVAGGRTVLPLTAG